jgi:hypothetical protein
VTRPALAAAAALLLLGGCSVSSDQEPPRQSTAEVSLRDADLPAGMSRCTGSGPIDGYLKSIGPSNPSASRDLSASWQGARAAGADSADVVMYGDDSNRCSSGLISPAGRSGASLVIRYPNDRTATAAWKRGILDLPPPAGDEQGPGLTQGFATGLGRNAWSYARSTNGRPSYVAFWQNGSFDILVATGGLTPEQSRVASVAVSGRVR